jgi:hypothetical protein
MQKDRAVGEVLSNIYAATGQVNHKRTLPARLNDSDDDGATVSSPGSPSPAKRATCSTTFPQKRGFPDSNVVMAAFGKRSNGTTGGLVRRALPNRVDLRTPSLIVKNQGTTGSCASHAFTTMMEGSAQKQLYYTQAKQLSVPWIARCQAGIISDTEGATWDDIYGKVKDSYQATESCMPWSLWFSIRSGECKVCYASAVRPLAKVLTRF